MHEQTTSTGSTWAFLWMSLTPDDTSLFCVILRVWIRFEFVFQMAKEDSKRSTEKTVKEGTSGNRGKGSTKAHENAKKGAKASRGSAKRMTPKDQTGIMARDIVRVQRDFLQKVDEPAEGYPSDREEREPVGQATHNPTLLITFTKCSWPHEMAEKFRTKRISIHCGLLGMFVNPSASLLVGCTSSVKIVRFKLICILGSRGYGMGIAAGGTLLRKSDRLK